MTRVIRLFLSIRAVNGGRWRAEWWSRLPGATRLYSSKPCATELKARLLAARWLERMEREFPGQFVDTTVA